MYLVTPYIIIHEVLPVYPLQLYFYSQLIFNNLNSVIIKSLKSKKEPTGSRQMIPARNPTVQTPAVIIHHRHLSFVSIIIDSTTVKIIDN